MPVGRDVLNLESLLVHRHEWMPLVRTHLSPDGTLVFSHAPAISGSYGPQGMYANGFTGRNTCIYRWSYEPDVWAALLHPHRRRPPNPGHSATPAPCWGRRREPVSLWGVTASSPAAIVAVWRVSSLSRSR